MKLIPFCLLLVLVSATVAQITFTREWVKGKRSTTANAAGLPKDGHVICRNLVSAVEYLIELEKVRKAECAECCHSPPPAFPILPDIQRSPSDFMTFVRDIPAMEQEQADRSSTISDRRSQ